MFIRRWFAACAFIPVCNWIGLPYVIYYSQVFQTLWCQWVSGKFEICWMDWCDIMWIDKKLENFNTLILSVFNWNAPVVTSRVTKFKEMWCNPKLKCLMTEHDVSLLKYKCNKLLEYVKTVNRAVNFVRMEKRHYIGSVASHGDYNSIWLALSDFNIETNKIRSDLPSNLSNSKSINAYFSSVFSIK